MGGAIPLELGQCLFDCGFPKNDRVVEIGAFANLARASEGAKAIAHARDVALSKDANKVLEFGAGERRLDSVHECP